MPVESDSGMPSFEHEIDQTLQPLRNFDKESESV